MERTRDQEGREGGEGGRAYRPPALTPPLLFDSYRYATLRCVGLAHSHGASEAHPDRQRESS